MFNGESEGEEEGGGRGGIAFSCGANPDQCIRYMTVCVCLNVHLNCSLEDNDIRYEGRLALRKSQRLNPVSERAGMEEGGRGKAIEVMRRIIGVEV